MSIFVKDATCGVCGQTKFKKLMIYDNGYYFCQGKCHATSQFVDDIYCPFCNKYFWSSDKDGGECVYCGNYWVWDERCTPDYSDCWDERIWPKFIPGHLRNEKTQD